MCRLPGGVVCIFAATEDTLFVGGISLSVWLFFVFRVFFFFLQAWFLMCEHDTNIARILCLGCDDGLDFGNKLV